MRRRHDPIAVPAAGPVAGEAAPQAFRWRGRVYLVTEVLGHWVEAAAWWRPPRTGTRAGARTGTGLAVAAPAGVVQQRRWWRVAARPSHPAARGATGVYELCCSGGTWSLRRVHD